MDIYFPSKQRHLPQRSLSPITHPNILIVGIFGSKTDLSEIDLYDKILNPVLSELGRIPEKLLLPVSNSALGVFIDDWGRRLNIPTQSFEADFRTRGRSAAIFRDARIEKECTIAIVFQAPRSTRYDLLAERMARKGKRVFFVKSNLDVEELCLTASTF